MDYQEECRLKAERVRQALNRLGGEALEEVPILPAPEIFHYRNKAQYPVAPGKGRAVAGFYRAGTHQVVACPQCGILPPEMDAVRDAVVDYMNQYRVSYEREGSERAWCGIFTCVRAGFPASCWCVWW